MIINFPNRPHRSIISPDFARATNIFAKCLTRRSIEAVEAYLEGKVAMGALSEQEADYLMDIFIGSVCDAS